MMNANTPAAKDFGLSWPALDAAQEEIGRLERDRLETDRRLGELQTGRDGAAVKDREAYARALLEGEGKPEASAVADLEREISELQERREALTAALRTLAARRDGVVSKNAHKWRREVLAKLPERQRAFGTAVNDMQRAISEINQLATLFGWLGDPTGPRRRKRAVGTVRILDREVDAAQILEGLRAQVARLEVLEPEPQDDEAA